MEIRAQADLQDPQDQAQNLPQNLPQNLQDPIDHNDQADHHRNRVVNQVVNRAGQDDHIDQVQVAANMVHHVIHVIVQEKVATKDTIAGGADTSHTTQEMNQVVVLDHSMLVVFFLCTF